jgi:4-amino-4-deoxychorismate lyase
MCRLIESIRVSKGVFHNLHYHATRMMRARGELFGMDTPINLQDILANEVVPQGTLFKCRIVYDSEIRKIEFQPYTARIIRSIKLVNDNEINYHYKFEDRKNIEAHVNTKGVHDDIVLVKNGFVTDSSYANIVFNSGNEWITPSTPLLCGVMRQHLLDQKIIREDEIKIKDIANFKCFKLINAMIGFDAPAMEIEKIIQQNE